MIMLYLCGTNAHVTVIIWNFLRSQLLNQIKQNLAIIAINRYFTNKIRIYLYLYLYQCIYHLLRESNNCKTGKLFRTPPINIQSSLDIGSATKWTENGLSRSHEPIFSIQFIPWDVFLNDLLESLSIKVLLSMITQFSRMTGTSCKTVGWGNYFVTWVNILTAINQSDHRKLELGDCF